MRPMHVLTDHDYMDGVLWQTYVLDCVSWTSRSMGTSTLCGRGCRKLSVPSEEGRLLLEIGKKDRANDNKPFVKVEVEMLQWSQHHRCLPTKREKGML